MALIRSSTLSNISGSIGGTTYSRNRFGAYARNRTVPVNPNTTNQLSIRTAFTMAAQYWSATLTPEQRTGWALYAAATPWLNKLGETVFLSGFNMYCRSATFRLFCGGDIADTTEAPGLPGIGPPVSLDELTVKAVGSTDDPNTVIFVIDSPDTADFLALWIGLPQSSGVNFYKGPWTFVAVESGVTGPGPFTEAVPFTVQPGAYYATRYMALQSTNALSTPAIVLPQEAIVVV